MTAEMPRQEIERRVEWLLGEAADQGAWGADILFSRGFGNTFSMRDEKPEENSSACSFGIGLRVLFRDGRQGVAYSSALDRDSLRDLASWSLHNARAAEPEEGISLYAGPLPSGDDLRADDPRLRIITHPERVEWCREMSSHARGLDPRIVSVRSASWNDGWGETLYASSAGLLGWESGSAGGCSLAIVASDGDVFEMGGFGVSARRLEDIEPIEIAERAVERTLFVLGGEPVSTDRYFLLLQPECSASLVAEVGELFCASDVHKNRSLMKGKLGTPVASGCFNLVDDGRIPWRLGTSPFDGEGVPTGRTCLIDAGVACSYLYNLQYAHKDGVSSTGNASRGMASLPDVGTSNLVLESGSEPQSKLIERIDRGIVVAELMGLHTLDPVSGDFSLGVKGALIEKGRVTRPVAGMTVAGNLMELLAHVVAVGDDGEFFGSVKSATLVIENVVAAGL